MKNGFPDKKSMGSLRLKSLFFSVLFALLLVLPALPAQAEISHISEQEFRALAEELAPKVNLFRDVWAKDPDAVFYGGTSRDYLYWLKGKFKETSSRGDAEKVIASLIKIPAIDVREFIIGESDVDIVSAKGISVDASRYGVRKIDSITPLTFDMNSEAGKNELWQGHIPAEKIRIGANGISQDPQLGDGLGEIYRGKLSVRFADPKLFAQTKYAKEGENHPILLALRYLRLQGINYFQSHGAGLPNHRLIEEAFDPDSAAAVKKVIVEVMDGKTLRPYLRQQRFLSWLNGTIQKSFRSYTNPTAALEIMKKFGADRIPSAYSGQGVETANQYVFAQYRDPAKIRANMEEYGVDENKFLRDPKAIFPDGHIYHGTKNEQAFRSILFQGVLPSESGSGGKGLYGVNSQNMEFAEGWGGDANRLVRLPVRDGARVVDIGSGEGKRVFKKFGKSEEEFAEAFGVDIIEYPYATRAFVVKNSTTLGAAEGVHRQLLTYSQILDRIKVVKDPKTILDLILLNQFTGAEAQAALAESTIPENLLAQEMARRFGDKADGPLLFNLFKGSDFFDRNAKDLAGPMAKIKSSAFDAIQEVVRLLEERHLPITRELAHDLGIGVSYIDGFSQEVHRTVGRLLDLMPNQAATDAFVSGATAWSNYSNFGLQVLLKHPRPDLVGPIRDKLTALLQGNSKGSKARFFVDRISPGWNSYPELMAIYFKEGIWNLKNSEDHHDLSVLGEAVLKHWADREELVAGFFIRSEEIPEEFRDAIQKRGWASDAKLLRRIVESTNDKDNRLLERMALTMLAETGAWRDDPDLLRSLLRSEGLYGMDLGALFSEKSLNFRNSAGEGLLDILTDEDFLDILERKGEYLDLMTNPKVESPAVVKRLFRFMDSRYKKKLTWSHRPMRPIHSPDDFGELMRLGLRQKKWSHHPELLEEYALRSAAWPHAAPRLERLLEHPHWLDNPHFASIKKNGRVPLGKLRAQSASHLPEVAAMAKGGLRFQCSLLYNKIFN